MFIISTVSTTAPTRQMITGQQSIPLILTLIILLCRQIRKNKDLSEKLQTGKNQTEELKQLLDCVADQGKINDVSGIFTDDPESNSPENNQVYKFAAIRSESLASDKKEEYLKMYRQFFSGKSREFSIKYSLQTNGQLKELYDYARIIDNSDSMVKKFILTTMDISELAKQTRELAHADTILNASFDNLPGHLLIKNMSSDFSYIRCNNSFSSLLQMHPAEIAGKTDFDLFDRELAQRIRFFDMQLAANRTTIDNQWFFTTPDGKDHAIRFISRLLKRPDGSEVIIAFGIDVTRQERLAGKLRKRNKELRLLLAQSNNRTMLLDTNLSLVCAAPAMQELFPEQQPDPITSITCSKLCSCNITAPASCPAAIAAASGKEQICRCAQLQAHHLSIKPLLNENGTVDYLAVTALKNDLIPPGEKSDD